MLLILSFQEELELEENKEAIVYDNYKFLTREDLDRLNLTNLIGTNLLIAIMHGYFIDHRLYKKVSEACMFPISRNNVLPHWNVTMSSLIGTKPCF